MYIWTFCQDIKKYALWRGGCYEEITMHAVDISSFGRYQTQTGSTWIADFVRNGRFGYALLWNNKHSYLLQFDFFCSCIFSWHEFFQTCFIFKTVHFCLSQMCYHYHHHLWNTFYSELGNLYTLR